MNERLTNTKSPSYANGVYQRYNGRTAACSEQVLDDIFANNDFGSLVGKDLCTQCRISTSFPFAVKQGIILPAV